MGAEKPKNETKMTDPRDERIAFLELRVNELERTVRALADRLPASTGPRVAVVGGRARIGCAVGHAMQPTDDYCQACHRGDPPNPELA